MCPRDPQTIECAMAAHETNQRTFDGRSEWQFLDQLHVHSRGVEPSAGYGHQVCDVLTRHLSFMKRASSRAERQRPCLLAIVKHALPGRWARIVRLTAWE